MAQKDLQWVWEKKIVGATIPTNSLIMYIGFQAQYINIGVVPFFLHISHVWYHIVELRPDMENVKIFTQAEFLRPKFYP